MKLTNSLTDFSDKVLMPEKDGTTQSKDAQNDTAQPILYPRPRFGTFVGREWELSELQKFLSNHSRSARSIMLVYGPRGIGKSALVCEAANRSAEQGLFQTIVWLDRTRATELLLSDAASPGANQMDISDPRQLSQADSHAYMLRFMDKRDETSDLSPAEIAFFRELIKNQPYLLIIDDFDEHENLGSNSDLCERLARVEPPNKIILTTRLMEHRFSQPVYEALEVGLLEENEVRALTRRCGINRLDPERLVGRDFEATAMYFWQESGGLPEFLMRFLIPILEQKGWLLQRDPRWQEAFTWFSAGYIGQREQERVVSEYEEKKAAYLEKCEKVFENLGSQEIYLLAALAEQQPGMPALEAKELARALGFKPEDKREISQFHESLASLHRKRFIGQRLDRELDKNKRQFKVGPVRKWVLLPFTRKFIKNRLFNGQEAETEFRRNQVDRWIQFVEGYAGQPEQIEHQLDSILSAFSWCVERQEGFRVIRLGKLLSQFFWRRGFQTGQPEQKALLINVCQETAKLAQQPEFKEWETTVDQWMLLARLYADNNDPESKQLALKYAGRAVHTLEKVDGGPSGDGSKWASAACLMAEMYLQNKDAHQAQLWLEKVEAEGQIGRSQTTWFSLAHSLARKHLQSGRVDQAQHWLGVIINSSQTHHSLELAAQAGVDLAHICLVKGDIDQALLSVQQAKKIAGQSPSSQEIVELLVKILAMEAQIAYHSNEIEECIELLEEAINLAKSIKLGIIADELRRWLNFVRLHTGEFDPTGGVDKLLGARLLWGAIESQQHCPVCRQEFKLDELFRQSLWLCPGCETYSHIRCLSQTENKCPSCQVPYIETEEQ